MVSTSSKEEASLMSKLAVVCAPSLFFFILLETVSVLVIASAKGVGNRPIYNSATVVLCAEVFKLGISLGQAWDADPWFLEFRARAEFNSIIRYAVPAMLYAINNNIYLKVLTMIHPSIFQLFMNMRVVWTGLVYRFTLGRTVTTKQWLAMIVLFFGCALVTYFPASPRAAPAAAVPVPSTAVPSLDAPAEDVSIWSALVSLAVVFAGLLLTLIYTVISTGASVIGEVLLKSNDSLPVANAQLYFFGVLFNITGILYLGTGQDEAAGYFRGWSHPVVWSIVVLMAVVGLITSRIMKHYDSIVKIFCVSMGNFVVYAYSVVFEGQPLALSFIVSFLLVSSAAYTYQSEKLRLDAVAAAATAAPLSAGGLLSRPEAEDVSDTASLLKDEDHYGGRTTRSGSIVGGAPLTAGMHTVTVRVASALDAAEEEAGAFAGAAAGSASPVADIDALLDEDYAATGGRQTLSGV
jgi:UDP-sugar transporter A1/2/3